MFTSVSIQMALDNTFVSRELSPSSSPRYIFISISAWNIMKGRIPRTINAKGYHQQKCNDWTNSNNNCRTSRTQNPSHQRCFHICQHFGTINRSYWQIQFPTLEIQIQQERLRYIQRLKTLNHPLPKVLHGFDYFCFLFHQPLRAFLFTELVASYHQLSPFSQVEE